MNFLSAINTKCITHTIIVSVRFKSCRPHFTVFLSEQNLLSAEKTVRYVWKLLQKLVSLTLAVKNYRSPSTCLFSPCVLAKLAWLPHCLGGQMSHCYMCKNNNNNCFFLFFWPHEKLKCGSGGGSPSTKNWTFDEGNVIYVWSQLDPTEVCLFVRSLNKLLFPILGLLVISRKNPNKT